MSKNAKIPRQSAVRHFEILEDTMIAHRITPDPLCSELDLVKHPKYYFFDTGVLNGLLGNFIPSQDRIGRLFEHVFATQLFSSSFAKDIEPKVHTFRTRGGLEVDFIVHVNKKSFAIELKSSSSISPSDIRSLEQVQKIYPRKIEGYLAYRGTKEQKLGKIWILPWAKVIKEIGL
jgi:predicted AAA+ superfamily ATPase